MVNEPLVFELSRFDGSSNIAQRLVVILFSDYYSYNSVNFDVRKGTLHNSAYENSDQPA